MASGTLKCQCGQVCGKFAAPKDSPSAACHCLDCIRFVDWTKYCKNCSLDMKRNHGGVQLVQLYKNQFQWIRGAENLRRARLSKCSPLERYFTSCCGTPIGFSSGNMKSFPLFIIYRELLAYENGVAFDPIQWRMNVERMSAEDRKWREEGENALESDVVPSSFFMTLLGRVCYGMFMGYHKPDPTISAINEVEDVPQLS